MAVIDMSLQTDSGCANKLSETIVDLNKPQVIQAKAFSLIAKKRSSILILASIMSLAVLGIVTFLLLPSSTEPLPQSRVRDSLHRVIQKEQWGSKPALRRIPLRHPTGLVIISHTATRPCSSVQDCIVLVKSAQNYHMTERNQPDVGYNFLIGGDGSIFEGRGWDTVNFHRNGSIGICFIGNYCFDYLNVDMVESVVDLLDVGVRTGKLKKNYVLVGHNQTKPTLSPGANVYKVIKNWAHFNASKLF